MPAGTILITGSTGMIGRLLVGELTRQHTAVRAMLRPGSSDPFSAEPLVARADGDFDEPASLSGALSGVDTAFLLTNSSERAQRQQLAFIAAASEAGVRHVVKLSQLAAAPDADVRFLRYHAAAEQALRESDLAWTFVRPNLIMQAYLAFAPAIAQGLLPAPISGEARVSIVDARDIAAVAAAALTQPGHEGAAYDVTGPAAITHPQIAGHLSAASGHEVTFRQADAGQFAGMLRQLHMPQWQADGLVEDYAHYQRGEAELVCADTEQVTGRPPGSFAAFADEHAAAWRA